MLKTVRIVGACIALSLSAIAPLFAIEKLTIVHLNDTHGQIEPVKTREGRILGGFARVAYLADSLRADALAHRQPFFFLHAGDALQGPPLSNVFAGELDFNLFNDMGLTAMAVGNHEFDFGQKRIMELEAIARFPLLSANVVDSAGTRPFQPFLEDSLDSSRLLVVGLTTETAPVTTYPPNVKNLRFLDAESTLASLLDSLGYGDKDIIIVLSHRGWEADSAMAEKVPAVDLVIGGHSHTVLEKPRPVAQAVICQAGARGIFLGRIDLEINEGKISNWSGELIPVTESIKEDSIVSAKIEEASATLDQKLRTPVGTTDVALAPGFQVGSTDAISLGSLLARLMLEQTKTDIAFTNQGGVRARIEPGPVTMLDILTALPFMNTVVTLELSGAGLLEVLNRNTSSPSDAGGKLHLAGVEWKKKRLCGRQPFVGGKPIKSKKTYKIATNNFLAQGGDGYAVLTNGANVNDTGMPQSELLARYLGRK